MKIIITGGAGFIGINAAEYYIRKGYDVTILDNLSRPGSSANLDWIRSKYPKVEFHNADIRYYDSFKDIFKSHYDIVLHLAAQVAVTTSVIDPRSDFEANAVGTFNVLEALRVADSKATLVFSSTNKVYGKMEDIEIEEVRERYQYKCLPEGVSEDRPLDFHSPYGCSKGAADQYVTDYSRIYGLKTVVLRQSCIYGYRQFGVEDQGWVAWFTIASIFDKTISIYGDGKQVRDVLFIEDLLRAFDLAIEHIQITNGKTYNIGGGHFQMSLLELVNFLEDLTGKKLDVIFKDWRPGDQPVYVSNISRAKNDLGWVPKVSVDEGIRKLFAWCKDNQKLFSNVGVV